MFCLKVQVQYVLVTLPNNSCVRHGDGSDFFILLLDNRCFSLTIPCRFYRYTTAIKKSAKPNEVDTDGVTYYKGMTLIGCAADLVGAYRTKEQQHTKAEAEALVSSRTGKLRKVRIKMYSYLWYWSGEKIPASLTDDCGSSPLCRFTD